MLLFWPVLGALIGFVASQKRQMSPVAGILGGLLLGPLAFLMFFVSGAVTSGDGMKTCHYCKERIKEDATICRFCRQPARPILRRAS